MSGRPSKRTLRGSPPLAPHAGVRRMGCGDVRLLNERRTLDLEGEKRAACTKLTVSIILPPVGVIR